MAAGLGYIEFATGDVLTASIANGYLASQTVMVFASAAARTSAIASPQEGMISYLKDTNSTEYYSGSAWVAIGGASASGLTFIANSAFSASASHTVSNCFSSTYTNYLILFQATSGTGDNNSIGMQLRASGTTTTTGYTTQRIGAYSSTLFADTNPIGTDEWMIGGSDKDFPSYSSSVITVMQPNAAAPTTYVSDSWAYDANPLNLRFSGGQSATTQFDSFVITSSSGNITGNVTIYGYQKN